MIKSVFSLVFVLSLVLTSQAKKNFVSKKGSDNNPGTKEQPFLTIQKAAEIMQPGDVCYIAAGIYAETVNPKNSGTAENPVIFKPAKPEGKVIISGADPIPAEKWEKISENIFKANINLNLGHENQVFLNGKTMVEARWPNVGDDLLNPELSGMDEGTTPEQIVDKDLPDYDFEGAHVWIHAPKYWSDWTTKIEKQIDEHTLQIENIAPYPGPSRHVAAPEADFFVFGCFDALDAENEWFYDEKEKALYVFRENGRLPEGEYLVKKRMAAFSFSDIQNAEVHDITVIGSTIETNENTASVLLNRLKIFYPYYSSQSNRYFGTQTNKGVLLEGKNCTIQNSEIAWSSACGIMLGGEFNKVLNCYIHDTDFIEFHLNHYAAYHLVYNNTFIADENGFRSTYGNKYGPDLLHCRWVNNIFSGEAETTADNYFWSPEEK